MIDAGTGNVLFERNADACFPPASTAKIMTAIVATERLPFNTPIVPSSNVLRVEPTRVGIKPGVTYELKDLIAAILINSANDAALAIAEGVAGSEKGFAGLMNDKALELGMDNTFFATASGLPTGRKDSQYTTAKDLVRLMGYAAQDEVMLNLMSRKDLDIYGSDKKKIRLKTHNKALTTYENAPWGKTGYTIEAKRTFAGIDPSIKPRIIFSLLRSESLWNDIMELNNKGLELHEYSHRTWIMDVKDWFNAKKGNWHRLILMYNKLKEKVLRLGNK